MSKYILVKGKRVYADFEDDYRIQIGDDENYHSWVSGDALAELGIEIHEDDELPTGDMARCRTGFWIPVISEGAE